MMYFPSPAISYFAQVLLFLSLGVLCCVFHQKVLVFFRSLSARDNRSVPSRDLMFIGAMSLGIVTIVLATIGLPTWVSFIASLTTNIFAPISFKSLRYKKYIQAFEAALAESLQTVASSLKAGLTLKDALVVASENCPEPITKKIAYTLKKYSFGLPIEEALDGVRKRVPTSNCNISFGAMIVSSQLGGGLPAMLKKIVVTIRERQRVEGKLKTLTAQGRSQAFLLCSAPPVLGIGMYFYDPQKMQLLTDYWVGQIFLCLAIVLEIVGIFVTSRVMRLEV